MLFHLCGLLSVLQICLCVDLTYYVEEGKSPGNYIGDIAADSHVMESIPPEDYNLITFNQMHQSTTDTSALFHIAKKTGKLYTAQTLDVESLCKRNRECFQTLDVAIRRQESFIKILEVKVVIQDVNDHEPEFPERKVSIEFSEESPKGAKRLIPHAIDKDVGVLNSQINYKLKKNKNEPFALSITKSLDGTSELNIILEERLDREVKDSYDIQVIAKDGGSPPQQSVLDVHISVTDLNDNPPVFSQDVYNISIKNEPSDTNPVVILSARDRDSKTFSKITYRFSSQTSDIARAHFRLNEATGKIFLHRKFTLGQELIYKLYVKASDGGSPPLSSIAVVLVNVINQQNNPPTIDVNFVSAPMGSTATISENIAVGSFIAYVKVTDNDVGRNGEVSCVLQHDKFLLQSLGPKKYKLIVKNPVDREKLDHYDITITCQDKGSPPLHSESKFSIKVVDVNDVQPQFPRNSFKFWIFENRKSNYPVGYINATDPDLGLGGKLTYSLLADEKQFLPFQISDSGLITTIVSLDHEFQDIYKFQVFVKDSGTPSLNNTVDVIIKVRDLNDNAPYFTFPSISPFTLKVLYYPNQTSNITTLKASDSDSRENAFLKYELAAGNDKLLFTINHYTGLLSFSRVVTKYDAGSYELRFIVKDSGTPPLSANTTILLILTVSNKTLKMLTADEGKFDDKIHQYVMIVMVLVAVTVSVPITAAVSICIIRCKDKKNNLNRSSGKTSIKVCEQRHLINTDGVNARTMDTDTGKGTHGKKCRRGLYQEDRSGNGKKSSAFSMKLQTAPDVIYREIGVDEENEQRQFMIPDCHSESEDGWSEGDIGLTKNVSDLRPSDCYESHSSRTEQLHGKMGQQRFFCPELTATTSRCTTTPHIGHVPDCTQWTCLKLSSTTDHR